MVSMVSGFVGAFCACSRRAMPVISPSTQQDSKSLFLFTDDLTGKIITALGRRNEFNTYVADGRDRDEPVRCVEERPLEGPVEFKLQRVLAPGFSRSKVHRMLKSM